MLNLFLILVFFNSFSFFYGKLIFYNSNHECHEIKQELADDAANITRCYLENLVPVKICRLCLWQKSKFQSIYEKIKDNEKSGVCENTLITNSEVIPIRNITSGLLNVWEGNNCDQCYNSMNQTITDQYIKYMVYLDSILSCLSNYTNATLEYESKEFSLNLANYYFNQQACIKCNGLYGDLNKYYLELENEVIDSNKHLNKKNPNQKYRAWNGICGDIGDAMNLTRTLWHQKFQCSLNKPAWYVCMWPLFTIFILICVFYCVSSLIYHSKFTWMIYRPKRLRRHEPSVNRGTMLRTISQSCQ